jgi:hypothetical protein
MGSMPNAGGSLTGRQLVPKKNSPGPMVPMAGMPPVNKKKQISKIAKTEAQAQIKNTFAITASLNLCMKSS